ncbi:MAG: histidine kinase [Bacteroidetes bacterium GWA2_30_7]|nr:MAG: histidine kinase [Bacteroidetes bacterium GWA2_30_7]
MTIITTSLICYLISDYIGYKTIALVLLLVVSLLAIILDVIPVLLAAVLSALIWDYFFIPPHFTLHVDKTEDALMLIMYFIIALVNGVLTTKIRKIEKITQLKEEKLNSIKLYNTLFNSISHELRTPISTIYGSTDNLLNNQKNLSEENKINLITEIHKASERLNRLVGNLLNISRLETGHISVKKDWCNVNELIPYVINSLEQELKNHNIKILIDEQFPLVKLDYGLMEQVISNIVYNASIYTVENTIITVDIKLVNNNLTIIISDNGSGISDDEIEKIFDKFYRIKATSANGTGLGLSIAKGFIEAHNGKIKAFNNELKGLSFEIKIPLATNEIMNLNSI